MISIEVEQVRQEERAVILAVIQCDGEGMFVPNVIVVLPAYACYTY